MASFTDRIAAFVRRGLGRVSQGPSPVDRLYRRGADLIETGRSEDAIPVLSQALEMAPRDVEVLERRATAYMMLDMEDEAIADLERAVAIDPDFDRLQAALGAAFEARDPERAVHHCNLSLAREPEDGPTLNNRAVALTWLGRDEEAAASLESGLALWPDEPYFLRNRAVARVETGDFEGAEADIERARASWPTDPPLLLALGRIALLRCKLGEAQDFVDSVLERMPGNAEGLFMQGMMAWRNGRGQEALALFDAALGGLSWRGTAQLSRRVEWMALLARGIARCHLGQAEGEGDVEAALKLRPRAAHIFERWGWRDAPG